MSDEVVHEFPVTLDEFCARHSSKDTRVELRAGFHHDETAAGRLIDLESAYLVRLDAYANRPSL